MRHTCVTLLAAAGVNPKAVQPHLRHPSITATMNRYTHLFPSDIGALVKRLDDVRARNLATQSRPNERSSGIEIGGKWQKSPF